ncbi:hypothetical protein FGE12_25665 [Aggregicoccus sp. 17bor-14]|uniref:hypothetical protein n=1 Tax=Myxococcaceae TaxID=31 RepID=UPI00129CDB40|nr:MULTISPECIES: hypothetical protein [Myxococcaceae]MBF5045822.1 hypothetical protein [Simulacricoccus sp. 17bor-14]MRI91557.1 hypothetical protein [Aggregicoccus sp. 17bor-14]
MTDEAFLRSLEDGSLPGERFDHRAHLRLTWLLLRRHGAEEGAAQVAARLRSFSAAKGAAHKFHATLTRAWAAHVWAAMQQERGDDFERFLSLHPELLGSAWLERHYRAETLGSAEARSGWVPPDLLPLPSA